MNFWDKIKKLIINLMLTFTKKIKVSIKTIKKADKNEDGYISLVEILESFKDHKVVCKIINFIDKWLFMFISVPVTRLVELDEDKDGFISIAEIWKYIKNKVKNSI